MSNGIDVLTVLAVDDELHVREELSAFDWQSWGSVLVDTAVNGKEALELCRRYRPDVVITDIIMPVMDGLSLLESIGQELPDTQVVILTVHKEFEYAREAIRHGALDYLTKVALEEDEIAAVLDRARNRLRERALYRLTRERQGIVAASRRLLQLVRTKDADPSEFDGVLSSLGVRNPYQAALLFVSHDAFDWPFFQEDLVQCLELHLPEYVIIPSGQGLFLLCRPGTQPIEDHLRRILPMAEDALNSRLSMAQDQWRLYCVLLQEHQRVQMLKAVARRDERLESIAFYGGAQRVFTAHEAASLVCRDAPPDVASIDPFTEFRVASPPFAGTSDQLLQAVKDWARRVWPSPSLLKRTLERLLLETSANETGRGDARASCTFVQALYDAKDLDELISVAANALRNQETEKPRYRVEIRRAIEILNEEYARPIGLQYVADAVQLSSAYLSHLFHAETGKTFRKYLLGIRLERARELLGTTNLRVYEVCERVGIPNYRYFSLIFRRCYGKTPRHFQARIH